MTVCWPTFAFNMLRYTVLPQTDLVQHIYAAISLYSSKLHIRVIVHMWLRTNTCM